MQESDATLEELEKIVEYTRKAILGNYPFHKPITTKPVFVSDLKA